VSGLAGLTLTLPMASPRARARRTLPVLSVSRPVALATTAGTLPLTAEARRLTVALLRAHLAVTRSTPRPAARAIAVHLALMHREVGKLAFGSLTLGPRQRGANETTMDRPFVFRRGRGRWFFSGRFECWRSIRSGCFQRDGLAGRFSGDRRRRLGHRLGQIGHVRPVCVACLSDRSLARRRSDHVSRRTSRGILLPTLRRHLRVLVFVVRIARGAAGLLHLVLDHRHDCVVRDPSFARTVIVHDVTEPWPALLHELPRSCVLFSLSEVGRLRRRVQAQKV
jgi:hypothetical protein